MSGRSPAGRGFSGGRGAPGRSPAGRGSFGGGRGGRSFGGRGGRGFDEGPPEQICGKITTLHLHVFLFLFIKQYHH